jgi:hypothetical protein
MPERTVTEKNIRDAIKNRNLNPENMDFKIMLKDLFPPPFVPKEGEVIYGKYLEGSKYEKTTFSHMCGNIYMCENNGLYCQMTHIHSLTSKEKGV